MTARALTVAETAALLREKDDILIVCHARPDGDAVGCGVALERILTALGKSAYLVCNDTVPQSLCFLLGYRPCGRGTGAESLRPQELPEGFVPRFTVTVDVASLGLTGMEDRLAGRVDLKIDHHSMGEDFAPLALIYPGASACGEIIYDIATELSMLECESAKAIYAAISSDSGSFRFDAVTPETILRVYGLMKLGIDHSDIAERLYNSRTREEMAAQRVALNNLEYYSGGRIAMTHILLSELESGGFSYSDTGSVNSLPITVEGVELGITVKQEEPGRFKLSVRSGRGIAANKLCALFGGGGHERAAGAAVEAECYEAVRDRVLEAASELFGLQP